MLPLRLAGEFGNDSECVFVEISDMSDMSAMMAWVFASRISSSYPRQHTDTTAKTNGKKKKKLNLLNSSLKNQKDTMLQEMWTDLWFNTIHMM